MAGCTIGVVREGLVAHGGRCGCSALHGTCGPAHSHVPSSSATPQLMTPSPTFYRHRSAQHPPLCPLPVYSSIRLHLPDATPFPRLPFPILVPNHPRFASTYQMLRGTLVLFAGFFTVLVLRRRLYIHHWLGMALITGGAALVGAASVLSKGSTPPPASPPPYFPPPSSPGNGSSTLAGGSSGLYDAYGGAVEGGGGLVAGVRRLLVAAVAGGEPGVDAASAPLFGDLCVVAAQAFTALQVRCFHGRGVDTLSLLLSECALDGWSYSDYS